MLAKAVQFLKTDLWRIQLKNYSRRKSFLLRQLRIVVLSVRGFAEDKCKFRASALTFFSLLSIVPVIAMMFGIAKGFGLEERVKTALMQKMQGQEEIAEKIIGFSTALLENASGGVIAGIGVAFLFWAIIKVLSNIENSFNDIWGIKNSRSIGRKFSDYLSMMLICPFLLIMASSATVVISSQIMNIIQKFAIFNSIGPLISFLLRLLPYCTIWVMFTFVFIFMPNTKVRFSSGLLAGIVAGTIFQLVQWAYINFQIGAAKYSAIYGSFAALPLFLLWLQISWLVVLFGAEISFAHQNVDTYEFEQDCLSASYSFKKLLALLITHQLVKNFCNAEVPLDAQQISQKLEIPIRLVRQILFELVESQILSQAQKNNSKDVAYQPAVDVEKLTIKYVLDALEQKGHSQIPVGKTSELDKLSQCLNTFANNIEVSPANVLLKNL
ncbi:MAG: YihY/virulence factor BrkB family protein [Sedimentisphaerales bacterium]|nr:YihY/virulence factor BrkB family protein [Sedimentisphaerales bacterium]